MEIISGIYSITNTITNQFYIGSSKNIYLRWRDHKKPSTLVRYKNQQLYKDFVVYGISNFTFSIIEKCDFSILKERETFYIKSLNPYYNILKCSISEKTRNINKICGIYKITNLINNDFYIGSSRDIESRWHCHKNSKNYIKYPNSKLYQAIHTFNLANFKFEILEECDIDKLLIREQYYIDLLNPKYNIGVAHAKLSPTEYSREIYHKRNRDRLVEYKKKYNKTYQGNKRYYSRKCNFNNEIITLSACIGRLKKLGIPNPSKEAKKYLI